MTKKDFNKKKRLNKKRRVVKVKGPGTFRHLKKKENEPVFDKKQSEKLSDILNEALDRM